MGSGLQRVLVQFAIIAFASTSFSVAQKPMDKVLPDAPSPPATESLSDRGSSAIIEIGPLQTPVSVGLSTRQKYALAYRRIVSPQLPLKAAFVSGWELATGLGPDLPTNGWGPFAERFGYNAAAISTTVFINTAVVPSIVHQDPRYFPLGSGSVKSRIWWAVRSEFVGFGDDGRAMPNYGNLVGFALSSVAVNAYTPGSNLTFGDTAESYSIKIGISAGLNVAREFGLFDRAKEIVRHSKSADE